MMSVDGDGRIENREKRLSVEMMWLVVSHVMS